jgi:hypothetical protein
MNPNATNPINLDLFRDLQQQNARAKVDLMNHLMEVYRAVSDAPESLAPMLELASTLAGEVLATQRSIDAVHALLDQAT